MRFWKSLKSTGESLAGTLERTARKNSPKPNNHHHRESGGHLHLSPNTPRSSRKVRAGSETSSGDPIYEDYYDYNNSLQSSGLTFVELIKRPGTHLGVIVSGGIDTGLTPKIVDLIPGSWAQRSDVLCIGDVIVSVNGISTETMTQKDLVKTLDVSDRIQLEVKYKLPSYRHRTHTRKITTKFIQITLKKENGSFGVVIRGGNHDDPRRVRPFTVMYVTHKSVANKEGTLRVNDRILSINGAALRGMKLPELQSLLYRQDGDTVFTVEYDVAIHPDHELGRPILVEIRKEGSDILGFGLNKCNDSGHVYIESVKQASLAERCGGIHVGDILLSVNGRAMSRNSDIDQISDLIRGENNRLVQLEILPGIFSNARSSRCSIPSPTYSTLSSSHHKRSKSSSRYPSGSSLGNGFQPSSTSPTPPKVTGKKVENMRRKFVAFTVELQRDGCTLGLTLATEDDADIPAPIFISGLVENGLAERTKTIQINDQVMEINGTPIHDKSLNEVIPLLQSSHEVIKLKLARLIAIPERDSSINGNTILRSNSVKLSRKPPLPSPSPSPRSLSGINTVSLLTPLLSRSSPSPVPLRPIPMEVHKIILFKDKVYEDFGFSVSDGLYDKGIYINRIRKGGPAHSCELLQPFDRILQINDTRTHEFDCCLAVPLIAAAGDKIELLVTRSGGPLPEIKDYPYSNGSTKTLSEITITEEHTNNPSSLMGTLKKDDEILAWIDSKSEDNGQRSS